MNRLTATSRPLKQRGTPVGLRFFAYTLLALMLMYIDQRSGWVDALRYALQAAAYPVQIALNSPAAAWQWTRATFADRAALQAENRALREQLRATEIAALRRADLERENGMLRRLDTAVRDVAEKWLAARVLAYESLPIRHRLTLDRGTRDGVFRGQVVVAGRGVLGQTLAVGPFSSEVILLSDPEHSVPVQILRTGQRTLAVGTGHVEFLNLPFLPLQTDVRTGDVLVTSGLGGIFPAGYPVAVVREVRRDGRSPLAQVEARLFARADSDRSVALLWFRPAHTAAPAP